VKKDINGSFKTEFLIWASLSLILTLSYALFFSLWVVGYFLGVLTTFSLSLLCWRTKWLGFVVAILLTGLFYVLNRDSLIIFIIGSFFPCIVLSLGLKHKKSPVLVILSATIPQLVILGLWVVRYSEMVYFLNFQLQDMAAQIAEQAKSLGINASFLTEKAVWLSNLLAQLIFSFQFLSGLFEIFLIYLLLGFVAGKMRWDMVKIPLFYVWQSKPNLAWVFLLSFVLFLIDGKLFEIVSKNILLVVGFWYAVLGFSISEWFLKKSKTPYFRIGFYIFALLTQILAFVLLSIIGFFDSWLDFRKLSKKAIA
jgi:hypothetical protein